MTKPADVTLVSVLVPLYNHARYIVRCLDSILEDGHPRIEILIIDDGSKDDSVALAQQWYERQDPQLIERFEIESRPNKGLILTLNELVPKARGEYLILLASDDYLLPGGIAARLEYLQLNPSKLAVFGDCIVVDDSGTKTYNSGITDLYGGHVECLINEDTLTLELIYNWCVPGPGFMAHRNLYDHIGMYDEYITVEDWDMYLRIAARGLLGFIPCPVAAYRYHGGNSILNSSTKVKHLDSLMRTAWKNYRSFHGLRRYGLLYNYFKFKKNLAALRGQMLARLVNHIVYKLLYWPSIFGYKMTVLCSRTK